MSAVLLRFIRGTDLKPEPPVAPVAMGKATRGVELASVKDLDERQVAAWIAGGDHAVRERGEAERLICALNGEIPIRSEPITVRSQ